MGKIIHGRRNGTRINKPIAQNIPSDPEVIIKEKIVEIRVPVIEERIVIQEKIVEVIKEVKVEVPIEVIKEVRIEVPITSIKEVEVVKTIKVHDIEPVLEQKEIVRKLERKISILQITLVILGIFFIGGLLHG